VSFTESWQYPKPVQRPRPPVLVGSQLIPQTVDHIVEWADGWIPAAMMAKGNLAAGIALLRERFDAAGRNPDELDVTVFHTVEHLKERQWDYRSGAKPITAALIDGYEDMGVTRLCLPVPNEGVDTVLPLLDSYVEVVGDRLAVNLPAT
jgi:hypothetical protein